MIRYAYDERDSGRGRARMNLHKGLAESILSKRLPLLAHVGNDIWYTMEISP